MFIHTFKNTFKVLIRKKELLFWSIMFSLLLGTFFKLSLGNIDEVRQFNTIPISVNEKAFEDKDFRGFIQILEEQELVSASESSSLTALLDNEVVAQITSPEKMIANSTGIQLSIIENMMNEYLNKRETIMRVMAKADFINPEVFFDEVNYVKDISSTNMSMVNTYFYTLIGMQAMYGYMWGMTVMFLYEANLSSIAKRQAIAPTKKWVSLSASLLVSWLINILGIILLMLYVNFGLKVELGERYPQMLSLVTLGSLTGVSMGALIAVSNKKSENAKVGLGIVVSMVMSFLAGMMVSNIKIIIQNKLPLLNKINPVALITDSMYSLYYYESLNRFYLNMVYLAGVSTVLIALTLVFIKGKKYESL